jgi:polar amino acid transport system substrate-binding protein
MKSTLLKTVFALLATSMISTAVFAESAMEKIVKTGKLTIAVQTQGPPVSFVNKAGKRTGFAVELARMMAEDMGVELVVQDYDWKGLIPALKSGKADFIAADMTPTAKRHMQVIFTEPVFFSETIAFAKADKGFKTWEDLNKDGISVGATQASSWADIARKMISNAKLKEYAGGSAATVQAVIAGRIDAGISDRATIAVRPDSLHLLHALNNYKRLIELDGRLEQKIQYWWNSTDWQADNK